MGQVNRKRRVASHSDRNGSYPSVNDQGDHPSVEDWKDYERYIDRFRFSASTFKTMLVVTVIVNLIMGIALVWSK